MTKRAICLAISLLFGSLAAAIARDSLEEWKPDFLITFRVCRTHQDGKSAVTTVLRKDCFFMEDKKLLDVEITNDRIWNSAEQALVPIGQTFLLRPERIGGRKVRMNFTINLSEVTSERREQPSSDIAAIAILQVRGFRDLRLGETAVLHRFSSPEAEWLEATLEDEQALSAAWSRAKHNETARPRTGQPQSPLPVDRPR